MIGPRDAGEGLALEIGRTVAAGLVGSVCLAVAGLAFEGLAKSGLAGLFEAGFAVEASRVAPLPLAFPEMEGTVRLLVIGFWEESDRWLLSNGGIGGFAAPSLGGGATTKILF